MEAGRGKGFLTGFVKTGKRCYLCAASPIRNGPSGSSGIKVRAGAEKSGPAQTGRKSAETLDQEIS